MADLSTDSLMLSPTLESLIRLLADGRWHSGEQLGDQLGVSRAAVSKQLKQFAKLGLELESVKGTGYRLIQPLDLLDEASLIMNLSPLAVRHLNRLHLRTLLNSTNTFLMQRMREGEYVHAQVSISEQQSAGRGRRGRAWFSPFGQNLYLSIAWHFLTGVSAIEGLSLAVGVAVCNALESMGVACVRLKWPNDVLVVSQSIENEGALVEKKLGGILIELGGDAVSECVAIIGLGLNVHMCDAKDNEVDQPWTSLSQLGINVSRSELAATVINELFKLLDTYEKLGFSRYQEAWNDRDAFAGERVLLNSASSTVEGVMQGVNSSGALQLRLASGELRSYIGGELSLRKLT